MTMTKLLEGGLRKIRTNSRSEVVPMCMTIKLGVNKCPTRRRLDKLTRTYIH